MEDRKQYFEKWVIAKVTQHKTSYFDAVKEYCDDNDIEYENVKRLITKPIQHLLETECHKNKTIKTGRSNYDALPI